MREWHFFTPLIKPESIVLFLIILGAILFLIFKIFSRGGKYYTKLPLDLRDLTCDPECNCYNCIQYKKEKEK